MANCRIACEVKRETVTLTKEKATVLVSLGEAGKNSKVYLCCSRKHTAEQERNTSTELLQLNCFLSL